MRNVSASRIERYVGSAGERLARARHDQRAVRLVAPEETVVRCETPSCRRWIRVVFVPGAQRYFCPTCDALLSIDAEQGGESA